MKKFQLLEMFVKVGGVLERAAKVFENESMDPLN